MTTLAEHMIVTGADNRPLMLEKTMYNSLQNHMLLYIKGKEHGRMMLNSILHRPLVYGTIELDDVTRTNTYEEPIDAEKFQDNCDVRATNIILQVLPPEVYSLVNHHAIAKQIWDQVKLLMQATELSRKEGECKLYNEFDRNDNAVDNYDNETSDDDNDDDYVEKDEEDGEEEEHLAPADPSAAGITEFAATLPSSSPPPENVEDNIRETMTTVDQGMSVEEIERVVAQRVANAIEAIAIYETKTNMARKSISQTEQQECKVADNANNKRKWEGNHNGQCTVKGGNCKKVGHMTRDCRNPAAARNQRTHTCYECGSPRHFKSECPIVKFQKCVDKKISTLSERQAEDKRKLSRSA
ncbi:reverse transcriptase domain-containing protein [Tanacetum coccineum]